ncbi:hypothetical protein K438DRAFT_1778825 [Mycena galopus ATCC 62051]|nr:hypothetical protein K438DRAFT_1778825 [Mycena galopus ATCC 62051]
MSIEYQCGRRRSTFGAVLTKAMICLVLFSIVIFNFRVHASRLGEFGGRELSLITSLKHQSHFLTQRDARFSFALQPRVIFVGLPSLSKPRCPEHICAICLNAFPKSVNIVDVVLYLPVMGFMYQCILTSNLIPSSKGGLFTQEFNLNSRYFLPAIAAEGRGKVAYGLEAKARLVRWYTLRARGSSPVVYEIIPLFRIPWERRLVEAALWAANKTLTMGSFALLANSIPTGAEWNLFLIKWACCRFERNDVGEMYCSLATFKDHQQVLEDFEDDSYHHVVVAAFMKLHVKSRGGAEKHDATSGANY